MAGVDFRAIRSSVSMGEVLQLIGFVASEAQGDQLRGPCPVHGSESENSRVFSAHLKRNAYQCFKCGSAGNQLDLYVAVTQLSLFEAARELCEKLDRPIPWLRQ